MSDFLRATHIKKTRKPHRCFVCSELIDKGFPAVEWVCIDDGVSSCHVHKECWDIVEGICFCCKECSEDDGYNEGFLKEHAEDGGECNAVAAFNTGKVRG